MWKGRKLKKWKWIIIRWSFKGKKLINWRLTEKLKEVKEKFDSRETFFSEEIKNRGFNPIY